MEKEKNQGFIKNTKTSKGRNLRLEVTGEVTQAESNFLRGISFFTAATLSKNSTKHITYVSGIMIRLIKFLIKKVKSGSAEGGSI